MYFRIPQGRDALSQAIKKASAPRGARAAGGARLTRLQRLTKTFRDRFEQVESINFFASAGHDRVAEALARLEERVGVSTTARRKATAGSTDVLDPAAYRGRVWVTRKPPGIDRCSSAWFIRRFVDERVSHERRASRAPPGNGSRLLKHRSLK